MRVRRVERVLSQKDEGMEVVIMVDIVGGRRRLGRKSYGCGCGCGCGYGYAYSSVW